MSKLKEKDCRDQMKEDLMVVMREISSSYSCRSNYEAWENIVREICVSRCSKGSALTECR